MAFLFINRRNLGLKIESIRQSPECDSEELHSARPGIYVYEMEIRNSIGLVGLISQMRPK